MQSTSVEDRLAGAIGAVQIASDSFDRAKAEAMLIGYHHRWSGVPMNVLAVDAEFTTPLVNPSTGLHSRTWRIGGGLDAIVRSEGQTYVVEHLTTSDDVTPGSMYWRRVRLDAQIATQLVGAKSLGFEAIGCIYDVVARPGLRPLKATQLDKRRYLKTGAFDGRQRDADETPAEYHARVALAIAKEPERYFSRGEVVRVDQDVADAAFDLWQTGRAIRDAELERRHPRNPDACIRWNRTCDFFDVCTGVASLEDPTAYRRLEADAAPATERSGVEVQACIA